MKKHYIIDAHCHIYPEKIAAKATESTDRFYDVHSAFDGSLKQLLDAGKSAGVDKFLVQSVATTPHQVESINSFIAREVEAHSDVLVGLGTMHPDSADICADVDRVKELGLHGIKMHPDIQAFPLDDERCMPFYERCAKLGLPVLMHTGDYRYDYSNPDRLLNVLKTFPKLTVVGAHFAGWSVWDEALEKLASFENLYVDSSSTLGFAKDEAKVKMLIEGWGEDKILFASDYPMWKSADEIKMLEKLNLSDTAYEKIYHLNAEKVYKL